MPDTTIAAKKKHPREQLCELTTGDRAGLLVAYPAIEADFE
jgi:hypothetical protein